MEPETHDVQIGFAPATSSLASLNRDLVLFLQAGRLPERPRESMAHLQIHGDLELQEVVPPSDPQSCRFKAAQDKKETVQNLRLRGWRATVLSSSILALVVLTVNIILMTWGISRFGHNTGESDLYNGACKEAQRISTALHVLINVLSTLLLSASNYTMQCLNSPTRAEIDRAHSSKTWLDIGIPSWRNRRFVSLRNQILWWMLGLSSVPLHFVYNSVIFLDVAVQEYQASLANITLSELIDQRQISGTWTEISWQECESVYNAPFVFDHGDVIFLTPDIFRGNNTISTTDMATTNNLLQLYNTIFFALKNFSSIGWNATTPKPSCNLGNCTLPRPYLNLTLDKTLKPNPEYHKVTSCYSQSIAGNCKLNFNITVIIIVIICNGTKAVCMFLAIWKIKDFPLVTLGDAIASFLEHPDATTKDMCLIAKGEIDKAFKIPPPPRKWKGVAEKAFYAISPRRWKYVNLILFATLACLCSGIGLSSKPGISAFSTGIGFGSSPHNYPTILSSGISGSGFWGNFKTIILVNTPQVLISLINVLYNGLMSSIMLVSSWNSFSQRRKALRVTVPLGMQKSQYYLTIAYRYAIPLLFLTGTFHWLISESFFLVSIRVYRNTEIQVQDSIFGFGYSALAITLAAIICSLLFAILTFKSIQIYKVGMPVAGSCSAVISAACYKGEDDNEPQLEKLMWGVVEEKGGSENGHVKGYRHCAFSSKAVTAPIPGMRYM